MTAAACGSCGAPTGDGAALCTGCTRDLAGQLLLAASIAGDLDDAVAKLLKRGAGGKRGDENPLPVDLAASEVRDELRAALRSWMHAVMIASGQRFSYDTAPAYEVRPMALWLHGRLDVIRQHPRAAETSRLHDRIAKAKAVVDHPAERVPAGLCGNCGRQLLAELGADSVQCACGMTALALQDKRRERAAAADVLGTPAEISGALAAIGIHVPRGTITSWASRQRLLPRPGGVFALSDVLALHAQSQARVRG